MVILQHYHPVISSPFLPPPYSLDPDSSSPWLEWELELAGQTPCFTKHRDGSLDAGNLCLYFPGPLVGLLRRETVHEIEVKVEPEAGADAEERETVIDPELLLLDLELPKTPTLKGKERQLDIDDEEEDTISRLADEDDAASMNLSPTKSVGAVSDFLYPASPVRSEPSPSPPPPLFTEFVPTKRNRSRWVESLKRSLRPRKERAPKDWPSWQEMTEQRNKRLVYQAAYDKARKEGRKWGSGAGPSEKKPAPPILKREDRGWSTDSTLTALSASSRGSSPLPEKRSRARDFDSLTPIPNSPSASSSMSSL